MYILCLDVAASRNCNRKSPGLYASFKKKMSAEPEEVICFSTGEDTVAFSGMCPFEDIPRFFLVKPMVRVEFLTETSSSDIIFPGQ